MITSRHFLYKWGYFWQKKQYPLTTKEMIMCMWKWDLAYGSCVGITRDKAWEQEGSDGEGRRSLDQVWAADRWLRSGRLCNHGSQRPVKGRDLEAGGPLWRCRGKEGWVWVADRLWEVIANLGLKTGHLGYGAWKIKMRESARFENWPHTLANRLSLRQQKSAFDGKVQKQL